MNRKQLDLEVDATGIDDQLAILAERAVDLGSRWITTIDHTTMRPTLEITDETVTALLKQAAAVQRLIDLKRQ